MEEALSFEDAATAHSAAWDKGDFEYAAVMLRAAKRAVEGNGRVVQMGDGQLQFVPNPS